MTTSDRENQAASKLQRFWLNKYGDKNSLRRPALVERMQLELNLLRGLRLLLLCACMFFLVIFAANLEKRSGYRLGLLTTYKDLFGLTDENLSAITTPDALLSTCPTYRGKADC